MSIQTKGLKRKPLDKFYTKTKVVYECLTAVAKHLNISKDEDLIIEPSAGNGAFIAGICALVDNYRFYDLKPEHEKVVLQDYLELNLDDVVVNSGGGSKVHVIGNPPFGRQSSLAIKFIKKSCSFCDSLSFILPKSFKKESMRKKIPRRFHLVYESDLPDHSFLVDGAEHDVPCVFQIWKKMEIDRPEVPILIPNGFQFVKKEEGGDISARRVGVNAGVVSTNICDKSIQSHYFIKFTNKKSIEENVAVLGNIVYEFNNSVGPKSISKQELIREFNLVL